MFLFLSTLLGEEDKCSGPEKTWGWKSWQNNCDNSCGDKKKEESKFVLNRFSLDCLFQILVVFLC